MGEWDANQVFDRVWVGAQDAADDLNQVRLHHITHIISVREPWLNADRPGFSLIFNHMKNTRVTKRILLYAGFPTIKKLVAHKFVFYLRIWANDTCNTHLYSWFGKAARFIHRALTQNSTNQVLVHCAMGRSRSATLAIAYQLWYSPHPLMVDELIKQAVTKRFIIRPNKEFKRQLETWNQQQTKKKKVKKKCGKFLTLCFASI
jgi:protein-tyrosine phosphatase